MNTIWFFFRIFLYDFIGFIIKKFDVECFRINKIGKTDIPKRFTGLQWHLL